MLLSTFPFGKQHDHRSWLFKWSKRSRPAFYEMNDISIETKVAASSVTPNEASRINDTSHTKPTIVLIHGLWMTPACWEDWGVYFTNLGTCHTVLISL
jgi:hypothetical protein